MTRANAPGTGSMLSPYRVLDLTDEKGLFCGKLLGDLGADVIKIERPGGDPARLIGPFYHDEPDPEKSLFWWAYNISKRGITLDITTSEGQGIFKRLVQTADVVVESFDPGYMDRLGLGYGALETINPRVIVVSITPFGQTGPYRNYKGSDNVLWGMGGEMFPFGDTDRTPVRISHHSQAYLHAGLEAAVGAVVALFHRRLTGEGQRVDVSVQESVAHRAHHVSGMWDMERIVWPHGTGITMAHQPNIPVPGREGLSRMGLWPCKDGYVTWIYWFGVQAKSTNPASLRWLQDLGLKDKWLIQFDASAVYWGDITPELMDRIMQPIMAVFARFTKAELLESSLKYRVSLYPVSDARDILENAHRAHLDARRFWISIEHPAIGKTFTYPGAFACLSATPLRPFRSPSIGEHNHQVFGQLGSETARPEEPRAVGANLADPVATKRGRPLEGIKVADFSWALVGPITGKTLSDFGATVVKIEGRKRIDLQRSSGFFKYRKIPNSVNCGSNFNTINTGKLSVAVNLSVSAGVELAKRFAAWADVVIENFAGGVMDRLGLGYEALRKVNPNLIMLSSCMMGQTGPSAWLGGLGTNMAALGGINNITGWPDRQPQSVGPYTDFIAPNFNVLAILAALDYRRRTGQGQYIDVSQYENTLHMVAPLLLDYQANGRIAGREGNHHSQAVPHGTYRCLGRERWCTLAVFTESEWIAFCSATTHPDWTSDPRFATLAQRKANEDALDALVETWTCQHTPEDVMVLLQRVGIAAGIVETAEDLMDRDPQLRHRTFFRTVQHPEVGEYRASRSAFILSKVPNEVTRAPLLGEHNEFALRDVLGLSEEDITDMVVAGALE